MYIFNFSGVYISVNKNRTKEPKDIMYKQIYELMHLYDIVFYCAPLTLFFHRYASVNLIWFVFAILASRCAGRCRHWYYCLSFLDGVRSGTVNVLDSLFFCCSTVSDSFLVFRGWAVLFRSCALQVERYSCFVFFFLILILFLTG